MAFKLNYSFEGISKTKPEQNLSGASKKLTKDVLLQKTHEERRKRQEQRLKLQSAELLQSHIRSYIVRKHKKDQERQLFDVIENTAGIQVVLSKLLFFYYPKEDRERLLRIAERLLNIQADVIQQINADKSFAWLIKRFLLLCLKNIQDNQDSMVLMKCLYIFTVDGHTFSYLVSKDYYGHLKRLLESSNNYLQETIVLIQKPFKFMHESDYLSNLVLSEFCTNFLIPSLTHNVKHVLVPYIRNQPKEFPFERLIRYLNTGFHFGNSHSLLYCTLELEPDDYEPNSDSVQVLSKLSANLYELKPTCDLTVDDSDDEEEEDPVNTEKRLLLSEYLKILNRSDKVRKWINFFLKHNHDESVLMAFTNLCHNLLLVYKDSMRKYLLLYKFGLSSTYLKRLWAYLNKNNTGQFETKISSFIAWREYHTTLSVFCDMFTFYTETLTDSETSDTSHTFTQSDLLSMSKLLKNVARGLIEVAFPMCRSSSIPSTPEVQHLYRACLNCVRMLYTLDLRKKFCPIGFWTSDKMHIPPDLARKDYLSKKISSFYGARNEEDDHLPPLSTIEQRSLAVLEELPFLVNFNTRFLLLRDLCRNSLGEDDYQRLHHELMHENVVAIRRTHIYEDAFDKISQKSELDLKHKLRIKFINNVGLEEAGIDGGGIFKEFLNEVLKTAFDPNRGFFLITADYSVYPNPNVHLIVDNFTDHYYFIGRLVGKAIFENILVDLPVAEFFLAKLLVDRAPAHYLKSLDPVLYRNLLYLRDYNGDISDLGLDFTTVNNDLGETRVMELKPNGANIPVTNENRLEYIQRLADLKLNSQLRRQCTAFRDGINSVVPLTWLKLFSHTELKVIIGGDTKEIDTVDLCANTVYGGDFTADHVTIKLFWKIVHKFTEVQKEQLLKFVTSCCRPPLLGFKELNPSFCIQSSGTENRMPTASTCLNLLKIPIITDEEVLRNKLIAALEHQAGFELS
ncbi:ubiquitin-protein ligase E3C [Diabrotica virgifera virgifera]|uniref:Ubiquitin-protein ligase E3C n=1 Tax=Diabrotica virgifera virgifera TaxID=50390 RepID=A0A6P7FW45_DIAVI|nr:ubiquitin-protein ligase E3C [Diabrotica virgifera virgifera]